MPRAAPPSQERGTSPRPSGLPSAPVPRPQRRAREASSAGEERCGSHGDRGARRTRLTRRWRGARTGGRVERDRDLAFAGVTADGQAGAVGREARAAASTATGVVAAPSAAAVETAASTAAGLLAGPVAEAAGPADAETVGVAGFAGTAARATKAAAGLATAEARARAGTAVASRRAAAGTAGEAACRPARATAAPRDNESAGRVIRRPPDVGRATAAARGTCTGAAVAAPVEANGTTGSAGLTLTPHVDLQELAGRHRERGSCAAAFTADRSRAFAEDAALGAQRGHSDLAHVRRDRERLRRAREGERLGGRRRARRGAEAGEGAKCQRGATEQHEGSARHRDASPPPHPWTDRGTVAGHTGGSEDRSVVVAGMEVDAGDAFGAEHRDVPAVVLDRESQVEAVATEVGHGQLLEIPRHLVVTPGSHDEHVPADLVAMEPGLGEVMDTLRPRREQHDRQRRVEEVEQHPDLLDDGIVATRVEERAPVPHRRFQVVLPASGVGQDAVEVDHRGRAGRNRPVPPRPVLWIRDPRHSSSSAPWAERYRSLMPSTTVGSASVVVSPSCSSSATFRRSRRMIFPDRVFGSSSVNRTVRGLAMGPIVPATWSRSSLTSSSLGVLPARRITNALIDCPVVGSVRPMTAASATIGWPTSACSTSAVEMLWPLTSITSSTRPSNRDSPPRRAWRRRRRSTC